MLTRKLSVHTHRQVETKRNIIKASMDPHILFRNITDTMQLYSIGFKSVTKARDIALKNLSDKKGIDPWDLDREIKNKKSFLSTLVATESKYKGLIRMLDSTISMAEIGRKYDICRENVRQIKKTLLDYKKLFPNTAIKGIIKLVERSASEHP